MYDTKKRNGNHYIAIDGKQTIATLQKEFNKTFPFLKIEFFREPCIKGKGNSKDKMILTNEIISRLQRKKQSGKILFTNQTPVRELEENFLNKFGICMQVFRKSGNVWLETTSTDDWTLEQQNEEGRSLAQHFKIERENPDDHDIY
ncbi:MAG TPA: hypothetical protein VJY62_21285 [Bacteroidia bacterium]|nr:hypothetical protein [Bacteroidia bacterium]